LALQSFRIDRWQNPRRRRSCTLSWNLPVVQSISHRDVSRLLLRDPAAPLTLVPALQVSCRRCWLRRNRSISTHPLVDFGVPPECVPISPSPVFCLRQKHQGSSPGLWSPTTHASDEGQLGAGSAVPATFRLQGLVTLLTAYSLRRLAGLVSSRQRSWDSSLRSVLLKQGGGAFSTPAEPACRSPGVCSGEQNPPAGTPSRSFRALAPARVPCQATGV
jgi:hypothetical protein